MEITIGASCRYIVVEMFERDVHGIHFCTSRTSAIKKANQLLEKYLTDRGTDSGDVKEELADLAHKCEAQKASPKNFNAWCNIGGDWDAHIIPVDSTLVSVEGGLGL